ncbi:uncharacterized protein MKK02DRAFT_41955 [Dioszegia hungarica]|uniref:RFX-type winged-helix domain-containing protein n=1 Tax=Dioszegia hungarica TaxID=4972 RepID=A0AA38HD96_9TREE|nr:uncharacterized protein MKK02DRAFT_41955 [Dioszegia hungarica]KAI9638927.1 hypothetical protein MKK02DRAFT_41955 [Dioszegia hungarica]
MSHLPTSLDDYTLQSDGQVSPKLQSPDEPIPSLSHYGLGPSVMAPAAGDEEDMGGAHWSMPDLFGEGDGERGFGPPYEYSGSAAPSYTPFAYPKPLHHATSASSLSSLSSSYSGLYVDCPPEPTHPNSHSRTSSISSVAGLHKISPPLDSWPAFSKNVGLGAGRDSPIPPKLHVQTQSLGRLGRMRSSSRVGPYDRRERSESLSERSEGDDDLSALVNSNSSLNGYSTPLTSIGQPLNLNRLTLHHRRSASNVTSFSPVRANPNPVLSRKYRSSSLLGHPKRLSFENDRLKGTAVEREETVRHLLNTAAEEMRALPSASQQDKAKSAWVKKWLQLSYTLSSGHTVPRQGLYASYTAASDDYGVRAINSASFGKAVRNAFPGIKTRRLGVRGNSKYHYISLRPAVSIEAERLNRFGDSSGQWHVASSDGSMTFQADVTDDDDAEMEELEDSEEEDDEHIFTFDRKPTTQFVTSSNRPAFGRRHTTSDIASPFSNAPLMPMPVYDLPGFPVINNAYDFGPVIRLDQVYDFWNAFCRHQELLVSSVRNQQFDRFDVNLHEFWGLLTPLWMRVCHHPVVSRMVSDGMALTYNHIIAVLTSNLQRPPSKPVQESLRGLATRLEASVGNCLSICSTDFSQTKTELALRAAHLMHRCVDLQQLSTALLPIITSPSQVDQMAAAWDQLDMKSIADQCALSCSCEQDTIEQVLLGFRDWLEGACDGRALERLGAWVSSVLDGLQTTKADEGAARSLVTRAGFLTSQIMRDFTLKSASSFGLFQIIKTWIDDWVAISVLRPSVLSSSSAAPSPTLGMSVSIPTHNQLQLSEEDLPTAVPPSLQDVSRRHHRPSSSVSSISSVTSSHFGDGCGFPQLTASMPDLTHMANLNVSNNSSSSTGFNMM